MKAIDLYSETFVGVSGFSMQIEGRFIITMSVRIC